MKKIKVLIVPDWVVAPIQAMGENLSVLTQPEKLLRILSKDDVAFYSRTIYGFIDFIDPAIAESIDLQSQSAWRDIVRGESRTDDPWSESIIRSIAELGVINSATDYLSFIMKHGANGSTVDTTRTIIGFDVLGYDFDSFLLRPKAIARNEIYQCYEDLFSVMHKFMPTHEIASLPFFKHYETQLNILFR